MSNLSRTAPTKRGTWYNRAVNPGGAMLKEIARMVRDGMSAEEIAVALKVTPEWVRKVVGADAFGSLKDD